MQLNGWRKVQCGVGMIEVLIALVIISVSMLGLAALQINSVRFNHQAYLRSQATYLAYDILDRMRANETQAESGAYSITLNDDSSGSTACDTGTCSTTALVNYDKAQWLAMLKEELPEGDGVVSMSGSKVTVSVQWDQSQGQDSETIQTYTLEALL
ncbi:type IV pilus modification protein PilV [Amphritea sp. 1_MG-2023]|uniref:type IV pilus modification protein PilV n=1 Tax=Amphritea sp. 1_MG-2023 TaxID=3062670 RepID=UPI0026E2D45D|nr:type IV pilus modification protein PilV [Amphritea sp. 1_MG-2023]MDO6563631.1 type IV pilus modification protein PilV [Amphritea sp. 1_MG-2023]